MPLKKLDTEARTFKKLEGAEIVYTVHRPFSSRSRRESIYSGWVTKIEGNNVALKNEKDLLRGRTRDTQVRSFIEFEELYKVT